MKKAYGRNGLLLCEGKGRTTLMLGRSSRVHIPFSGYSGSPIE